MSAITTLRVSVLLSFVFYLQVAPSNTAYDILARTRRAVIQQSIQHYRAKRQSSSEEEKSVDKGSKEDYDDYDYDGSDSWDVSTVCCNITAPKDEKYNYYNSISDPCWMYLTDTTSHNVTDFPNYGDDYSSASSKSSEENYTYEEYDKGVDMIMDMNSTACYLECLYSRHGAIDDDDQFVAEKAVELAKLITPIDVADMWKDIEECAKNQTVSDPMYTCNSMPLNFLICMDTAIDKNCPNENLIDDPVCRKYNMNYV